MDLRAYLRCKDSVLIGTDSVERMFPPTPPEGISLQVQRVDKPWPQSWLGTFDYVHQRLVLPGCEYCPAATAVKNLCDLVKPGGWVEILEQDHNPPSPGAFERAESMIREIFTVNGFGYDYPLRIKKWLEDAGMQDVRQEVIDVPVGALNPNPEMAQKSTWQISSALAGFLPMARGQFLARVLLLSRETNHSVCSFTAFHAPGSIGESARAHCRRNEACWWHPENIYRIRKKALTII